MISQTEALTVSEWDSSLFDDDDRSLMASCRRRLDQRRSTIDLIIHLNALISNVQLHRGMCMSLLAGSDYFKQALSKLERELYRQMLALELLAEDGAMGNEHSTRLMNGWLSITHDWHKDGVLENFELHSHFVEMLLTVVMELSKELQQSLPGTDQQDDSDPLAVARYPKLFRRIELLNFLARQLPQVIELVAKTRGLSCHLATLGSVDPTLAKHLRYLVETLKSENHKLRYQAGRLSALGAYASLSEIRDVEMKVLYFFSCLERDLLGNREPHMEGHQFFKLASEVIKVYSRVSEEGWRLLQRWEQEDWQAWICA